MKKNKERFTFSNWLALSRLPSAALLLFLTFTDNLFFAIITLLMISLTDFLDGYIARKRDEVTQLGKILDIAVDYALVTAIIPSLLFLRTQNILWLLITIPLGIFGIYYVGRLRRDTHIEGTELGKPYLTIAVFVSYVTLIVGEFWQIALIATALIAGLNAILFLSGKHK